MKNARAGKPHAAESENERPQILFESEKRTFVRRACNNTTPNPPIIAALAMAV